GNPASISNMLEYSNIQHVVDSNPNLIKKFKKIIIPGIGSFDNSIKYMNLTGIGDALKEANSYDKIILGICLGMQILFEKSEEGSSAGLALLKGKVVKFKKYKNIKIPHIGWNNIILKTNSKLRIESKKFYFLHSYHLEKNNQYSIANTEYFNTFPSLINYKNIYGAQFHPEKSGKNGVEFFQKFDLL
ncbi:imidazole glycerol phosphate synthase subunit HisH, partial [Alphaproteobacteria bacterium]|nr:imidazole glycerol phosphate synthase subunit HisH [Alphaproteobacteria bacterium]